MPTGSFRRRPLGREIEGKLDPLLEHCDKTTEQASLTQQKFDSVVEYLQSATGYLRLHVDDPTLESLKRRVQNLKEQVILSREDWMRGAQSLETIVSNLRDMKRDLNLGQNYVTPLQLTVTGPDQRGSEIISKVDPKTIAELRRGAST